MTYHTFLDQEPLGLNEQGDTEEWRMRHTSEQKTARDADRERQRGWMMPANCNGAFPAGLKYTEMVFTVASARQAHRRNTECNRVFGGSCVALSP